VADLASDAFALEKIKTNVQELQAELAVVKPLLPDLFK